MHINARWRHHPHSLHSHLPSSRSQQQQCQRQLQPPLTQTWFCSSFPPFAVPLPPCAAPAKDGKRQMHRMSLNQRRTYFLCLEPLQALKPWRRKPRAHLDCDPVTAERAFGSWRGETKRGCSKVGGDAGTAEDGDGGVHAGWGGEGGEGGGSVTVRRGYERCCVGLHMLSNIMSSAATPKSTPFLKNLIKEPGAATRTGLKAPTVGPHHFMPR
jgi:hypothetical protein